MTVFVRGFARVGSPCIGPPQCCTSRAARDSRADQRASWPAPSENTLRPRGSEPTQHNNDKSANPRRFLSTHCRIDSSRVHFWLNNCPHNVGASAASLTFRPEMVCSSSFLDFDWPSSRTRSSASRARACGQHAVSEGIRRPSMRTVCLFETTNCQT